MKSTHTLSRLASEAIGELNELRLSVRSAPEEEPIHRFRVLYKKTRALYRMAGVVSVGKDFRMHKTWKQIYQAAGMVRDTQILLKLVITQMGEGPLANLLQQQLASHQASFNALLLQSDPGTEHYNKWKKTGNCEDYFSGKFAELHLYYRQPLYDEELHAIRKQLKDIMYNQAWLIKAEMASPPFLQQIPVSETDALQQLLGEYQDNVVQASIVRQLAVLPVVREDSENLERWISQSFRKQVSLRATAEKSLENFFHLHAPGTLDQ